MPHPQFWQPSRAAPCRREATEIMSLVSTHVRMLEMTEIEARLIAAEKAHALTAAEKAHKP